MATSPASRPGDSRPLSAVGSDTAPDLDDLLVRTARGDDQAFAALYDALSASVLGLARRLVRNPARAEEVTQEVLDNPRGVIFDEAENRLHVQKAILAKLARGRG